MQKDFVGIWDNVLTPKECQTFIDYFDSLKSMDLVFNRQEMKDSPAHKKQDETGFILEHDTLPLLKQNPIMEVLLKKFWPCYINYVSEFSILEDVEPHGIISARLQKTPIGGGYHQWHFESSDTHTSTRLIAWMVYLNTVEQGGETEFLYQHSRIKAEQGRVVIWPAGFTHTHRGNPPLSNEKYILTGWLEFIGTK
jgi:hypothetical protein